MYEGFIPLTELNEGLPSLLHRFPAAVSQSLVAACMPYIGELLKNDKSDPIRLPSLFPREEDVDWFLEIAAHGLTLPLEGTNNMVSDCSNLLCEWLPFQSEKPSVPMPIRLYPKRYFPKILWCLHNIFMPRDSEVLSVSQIVLCHRVLRTIEQLNYSQFTVETWETLLKFLLSATSKVLRQTVERDPGGISIASRVAGSLYRVWLNACYHCFPSPLLWSTQRHLATTWRHHMALVQYWKWYTFVLTRELIKRTTRAFEVAIEIPPEMEQEMNIQVIGDLSDDILVQTWFRILHSIGNVADLRKPWLVGSSAAFHRDMDDERQELVSISFVRDVAPIFHVAMKTIGQLVDEWLILSRRFSAFGYKLYLRTPSGVEEKPVAPGFLILSSETGLSPVNPVVTPCDSVLNLFGQWLFEACSTDTSQELSTIASPEQRTFIEQVMRRFFVQGRASAMGTLCKIFASHTNKADISREYLNRFYLLLEEGLSVERYLSAEDGTTEEVHREVLETIICHGSELFCADLDGFVYLVPRLIDAIQVVFSDMKEQRQSGNVDLRREAIRLLLTIVCVPLQFHSVKINENATFLFLRKSIFDLILDGIQAETDFENLLMLLGGLYTMIEDHALLETYLEQNPTPANEQLAESLKSTFQTVSKMASNAIHVVSSVLIYKCQENHVLSMGALEFLFGMAKINRKFADPQDVRRIINWLCRFISTSIQLPAKNHSRDLHSVIVLGYNCLLTWLAEYPDQLRVETVLNEVTTVVELGISGSKSESRSNEPSVYKGSKELKPASQRVRECAELTLAFIMQYLGAFPSISGPDTLDSLLSEDVIKQYSEGDGKFRYFVLDHCCLLGLLEQPLGNLEEPSPVAVLIYRGPFGKHSYVLQLKHLKSQTNLRKSISTPRSERSPLSVGRSVRPGTVRHFPRTAENVRIQEIDDRIPTLEGLMSRRNEMDEFKMISQAIESETELTRRSLQQMAVVSEFEKAIPPSAKQEFQAARILFTNLEFFSVHALFKKEKPALTALNSSSVEFQRQLALLDSISSRMCCTVYLFYANEKQTSASDVIGNAAKIKSLNPHFADFVRGLGWSVDPKTHNGWAGVVPSADEKDCSQFKVFYWSDVMTEIAFVLPLSSTPLKQATPPAVMNSDSTPSLLSVLKVVVIWLQDYEPTPLVLPEELESTFRGGAESTSFDLKVIFVRPLSSGLYHVFGATNLGPPSYKSLLFLPLVSGMVVSKRAVPAVVRQAVMNINRRRRIDNEKYQLPHIRKKSKIQEMENQFQLELNPAQFAVSLFA